MRRVRIEWHTNRYESLYVIVNEAASCLESVSPFQAKIPPRNYNSPFPRTLVWNRSWIWISVSKTWNEKEEDIGSRFSEEIDPVNEAGLEEFELPWIIGSERPELGFKRRKNRKRNRMNEIFTRNRLVTCRTRCARIISLIPSKRCSAKIASVNTDISRSVSIHVFSSSWTILLPSRGDRISYRRVGRVERKNGKHRMVGNVARWNVTHPGEERGRVWGGRINILGATPWVTDSSSLRIPARPATTCCAHFLGRALPPFTVPSAFPVFQVPLSRNSKVHLRLFIYLFSFFVRGYENESGKESSISE